MMDLYLRLSISMNTANHWLTEAAETNFTEKSRQPGRFIKDVCAAMDFSDSSTCRPGKEWDGIPRIITSL